nr:hypothetical protein HmN_000763100 [Hymenolepis microstoma]
MFYSWIEAMVIWLLNTVLLALCSIKFLVENYVKNEKLGEVVEKRKQLEKSEEESTLGVEKYYVQGEVLGEKEVREMGEKGIGEVKASCGRGYHQLLPLLLLIIFIIIIITFLIYFYQHFLSLPIAILRFLLETLWVCAKVNGLSNGTAKADCQRC